MTTLFVLLTIGVSALLYGSITESIRRCNRCGRKWEECECPPDRERHA